MYSKPTIISLIGAIFLLAGCSVTDMYDSVVETLDEAVDETIGVFSSTGNSVSCEERTERQLQDANFSNAASIEMVIRHGEFPPMIIRMHVGQTYVLRLRNRDKEKHAFSAPAFFDAIAVSAAALDNDILVTRCPGPTIVLHPGQSFEMKLLAVTDGRFEYRDASSSIFDVGSLIELSPTGGIIRIEEHY